jgi:hypothetical protein
MSVGLEPGANDDGLDRVVGPGPASFTAAILTKYSTPGFNPSIR